MAAGKALPDKFKERFRKMLGEEELSRYEACLQSPMEHGLRVNTLRMSPEEFQRLSPWKLEPIPWCKSGFYLGEDAAENPPSRHPFYYAGAYYLQEPSAMLPAAALPIEPGDRVLDLCAAPGGKSTALAEKLEGTGFLLSNDISASRAKALIKNLELFGASNAVVTAETPKRLAEHFPDFFDKILIDAPCSGEGMFRKQAAMIHDWTEEKPKEYAALQREIVGHAIRMLRPGGMLLYSTCTYAPEEDEGTVSCLLNLPEAGEKQLGLMKIPLHDGFLPGNASWLSEEDRALLPEGTDLSDTVHLYPHRLRGEGHFAALFISRAEKTDTGADAANKQSVKTAKLPAEYTEFEALIRKERPAGDVVFREGYLSLQPEVDRLESRLAGLRVLRRGLYLGEIRKNRYEPSQALAMTLRAGEFANTLRLSAEDERVLRYLRGETLDYGPEEAGDGWTLVTVEGLPLGFGKAKNGSLKNKLLPGWRMT